ncbi:hypothetical protein D3C71_1300320 [compost metagenome]
MAVDLAPGKQGPAAVVGIQPDQAVAGGKRCFLLLRRNQRVDAFRVQGAAVGPCRQRPVGIGYGLGAPAQVRQCVDADPAPFQPIGIQGNRHFRQRQGFVVTIQPGQHVGGVARQKIVVGRDVVAAQVIGKRLFPIALVALGVARHEQQLRVAALHWIQPLQGLFGEFGVAAAHEFTGLFLAAFPAVVRQRVQMPPQRRGFVRAAQPVQGPRLAFQRPIPIGFAAQQAGPFLHRVFMALQRLQA